jgi:hypothetical protein
MSRILKNLICLISLVLVAQAAKTTQMTQIMTELKSEEEMMTPFGQDLMFMMEMKGPADSIITLLDTLKA